MIIDANFGTQLGGSITPTDVCCSCIRDFKMMLKRKRYQMHSKIIPEDSNHYGS